MRDGFVEAYAKSTGRKQYIPQHWLGHPVLGRDFELTPSTRDRDPSVTGDTTYPDGDPHGGWTRLQLDTYATAFGLDTTGLPNKADVVDAINNGRRGVASDPVDPEAGTAQGTTPDSDGTPPPDKTPAAGENQE